MSELEVTSPEGYVRLTTRKVRVSSGAVFKIRSLGATPIVKLLSLLPESGLDTQLDVIKFTREHFAALVSDVIQPGILAPKIADEDLSFMDAVDLLLEEMDLSGLSAEEAAERESFRVEPDRAES